MDPLAIGFEQPSDGVLCQPIDFEVWMQLAQFSSDGYVATTVPETDG